MGPVRILDLYNVRYTSNMCQILTMRSRREHLRPAEGWLAWLLLTVVVVGTTFIATGRYEITKLVSSDLNYLFVTSHDA